MVVKTLKEGNKQIPAGTMPRVIAPNIVSGCMLKVGSEVVGFYQRSLPAVIDFQLIDLNREILRNRKGRRHLPLAESNLEELAVDIERLIYKLMGVDVRFNGTITCYNSDASYHIDDHTRGYNACIVKRGKDSSGGNITIPNLNATFDQCDGSIVVFPAWRWWHGVTSIMGDYRNSIILYSKK